MNGMGYGIIGSIGGFLLSLLIILFIAGAIVVLLNKHGYVAVLLNKHGNVAPNYDERIVKIEKDVEGIKKTVEDIKYKLEEI